MNEKNRKGTILPTHPQAAFFGWMRSEEGCCCFGLEEVSLVSSLLACAVLSEGEKGDSMHDVFPFSEKPLVCSVSQWSSLFSSPFLLTGGKTVGMAWLLVVERAFVSTVFRPNVHGDIFSLLCSG